MIPAADLAPPTHEQLHRLRSALLGPMPAPGDAAPPQPLYALKALLDAVDNEPAAHLLCTESIDDPEAWAKHVRAARALFEGLEAALRGDPVPAGAETADPWATLAAAGFGKGGKA